MGFLFRSAAVMLVAAAVWAADLEQAARDLASPDAAKRAAAIMRLRAGGGASIPVLRRALAHSDPEVKRHARALLSALRADAILAPLASEDVEVRAAGLARLFAEEKERAFAFLEGRLDPKLAPALTDIVFYDWDPARREEAVRLLASLGPPHSLKGLAWAVNDRLGDSRRVARILADQGDASVLRDLWRAKRSGVPGARAAMHDIMRRERVGRRRFRQPPLNEPREHLDRIEWGSSPAERVRGIRAVVTGLLSDPSAARAVGAALFDEAPEVRRTAARAFGYLGVAGHEKALMACVRDDEDRAVRLAACAALGHGLHEDVQPFLLEIAARAKDAGLRRAAANALADAGDAGAAAALLRYAAKERDAATRHRMHATSERILARAHAQGQGIR